MAEQNFRFNKITGTLESVNSSAPVASKPKVPQKSNGEKIKLNFAGTPQKETLNLADKKIINTPKDTNERLVEFKEMTDYSVFQIIDETTGRMMAYIGGYALDISFNMKELTSVNKIEQCLEGLKKMFRKILLEQTFNKEDKKS